MNTSPQSSALRHDPPVAVTGALLLFVALGPALGCGLESAPVGKGNGAASDDAAQVIDSPAAIELLDRSRVLVLDEPVDPEQVPEPAVFGQWPTPEPGDASEPAPLPPAAPAGNEGAGGGAGEPAAPGEPGDRDNSAPSQQAPVPAFAFVSIDKRLSTLGDDLAGFDNPTDRQRMRYIDFSNLANAGLSDSDLEPYRQALSLLVNSLSQGDAVVPPVAIDAQRLFYRIDLRDYGWSTRTWELAVSEYPYAVSYDEDSRVLPYDERTAEQVRDDTRTLVPYVQADWFLAHASSAPRYYDILGVPGDVLALTEDLGVDVAQDIRDQQVVRAGFNSSGVARSNRVVERHELPGGAGSLFLTYDFADSVNERNVFAHPLDFQFDQSEGLFTLRNGLQGYFIADGGFRRLNKAAAQIVTDPERRDRAVTAGVSCMGGCHLAQGTLGANDEVRDYVVLSAPDGRTIDLTLGLYAQRSRMSGLIVADRARYLAAVAQTGFEQDDPNLLNRLVQAHEDKLDLGGVAAVLGIKSVTLARALDSSPQVFPAEILPLRDPGAFIQRETLDAIAGDVVNGLGLGTQLRP